MALPDIRNYYEELVQQHIRALELDATRDDDYIADLSCLVLNQLPAHYIRHGVDMAYFTSDIKRQEMEERVIHAMTSTIAWLDAQNEKEKETTTDESESDQPAS